VTKTQAPQATPATPAKAAAGASKTSGSTGGKAGTASPTAAAASPAPSRSRSKAAAVPPPAPATPPTGANRFTDRFAPAHHSPSRPPIQPSEMHRSTHKPDPKLINAWKGKAGRDLTEPELLAMPESEYMNDKQIDYFRALLEQQKNDLLTNAGETTEHLREDTSIVPDPVDRATIEEEHALELRTRDRERKLLKKVAQSLARLDSGEYGFCDETGEPIGLPRLLARPTATLSLEAQQRRELKQKMFGD
jgi:DnaK suppressor protein